MDRKIEKKKWTNKKILIVGASSIFVIIILYNFIWGDKTTRLNIDNEKITIGEVKFEQFQEFIPITGTVQPIQTFFLDVREGGRVVTKFVEEGAFVNAGDPIVKFDNAQLTLSIIYNEANVFQQINSLRGTRLAFEQNKLNLQGQILDIDYQILERKRIFDNNTRLFEKNLISKNEYDLSRDQYDYMVRKKELTMETYKQDSIFRAEQISQLEFSVKQLQQNLGVTKTQLENLTVRAPIKGQLTALRAEIGQSISQGQNLGQIDVVDSFKVRASIDEHYIARVNPGQTGEFTFAGETYRLVIKTVYPQVANGRFEVDMHFIGEIPKTIRRGQTLQIRLELGELSNALTVERGGFYQTTGGQWIFVIDESGDFAVRRDIKLGRQNSQVFEVLEGLKEGEKVITSSYENYKDIEKIVLK